MKKGVYRSLPVLNIPVERCCDCAHFVWFDSIKKTWFCLKQPPHRNILPTDRACIEAEPKPFDPDAS